MATDTSRFPGSLSRPLHTSPNSPLGKKTVKKLHLKKIRAAAASQTRGQSSSALVEPKLTTLAGSRSCNQTCWRCNTTAGLQMWECLPAATCTLIAINFFPAPLLCNQYRIHAALSLLEVWIFDCQSDAWELRCNQTARAWRRQTGSPAPITRSILMQDASSSLANWWTARFGSS